MNNAVKLKLRSIIKQLLVSTFDNNPPPHIATFPLIVNKVLFVPCSITIYKV